MVRRGYLIICSVVVAVAFSLGSLFNWLWGSIPSHRIEVHIELDSKDFGSFDHILIEGSINYSNLLSTTLPPRKATNTRGATNTWIWNSHSRVMSSDVLPGMIPEMISSNTIPNIIPDNSPDHSQSPSSSHNLESSLTLELSREILGRPSLHAWLQKFATSHPHPLELSLVWRAYPDHHRGHPHSPSPQQSTVLGRISADSSLPVSWSLETPQGGEGQYTEHLIFTLSSLSIAHDFILPSSDVRLRHP